MNWGKGQMGTKDHALLRPARRCRRPFSTLAEASRVQSQIQDFGWKFTGVGEVSDLQRNPWIFHRQLQEFR
jgi:hypothetical protein